MKNALGKCWNQSYIKRWIISMKNKLNEFGLLTEAVGEIKTK